MMTTKKILNRLKNNTKFQSNLNENELSIILDEIHVYETELSAQNQELRDKEKNILEQVHQYQSLFNCAPVIFLEIDDKGNIVNWNKQGAKFFNEHRSINIPAIKFNVFLEKSSFDNYFKMFEQLKLSQKEFVKESINYKIKGQIYETLTTITRNSYNSNYLISIEEITKEKRLHYSQSYLDNIFLNSPNIEIVTNGEEIDKANKVMLDFVGYNSVDEFKKDHDCICDYFLEGKTLIQAKMGDKSWLEYILEHPLEEHKIAMKNQEKRHYFKISVNEIDFDENDRYKIVFTDITEHENLKQRLEYALEGSRDGLFDFEPATNKIYYSPRWKEIIGYKDSELENTFEEWSCRVEPNDLQNTINDFQKYLNGETPFFYNIHRMKHKEGRWVYILARGQFSEDKQRVVGTHTDITEMVNIEQELKTSKEYLEDIFDINPNIIFMTNGEELLKANKAFLEFTDFDTIDKFKEKYDCICDMFEDKEGYLSKFVDGQLWVEYVYENKDSTHQALIVKSEQEYIFEISVVLVEDLYLVSFYDITALIEKDKLLMMQARSAAMGDMINMIAHQWRQPLAVLSMNANNMLVDHELGMLDSQANKNYADNILKQTEFLSNTIDDFRNFFKPTSHKEYVEIETIIDSTLEFMDKSLENHNIAIHKEYEKVNKLHIHSNELSHIIINLIKNAKEALEQSNTKNKKIFIRTYKNESIFIEIEDTAGGIDKEIIGKVFDPYFSTKKSLNGTGLGLYMNKMIIEDHFKGKITVQNAQEGAKFIIEIPLEV